MPKKSVTSKEAQSYTKNMNRAYQMIAEKEGIDVNEITDPVKSDEIFKSFQIKPAKTREGGDEGVKIEYELKKSKSKKASKKATAPGCPMLKTDADFLSAATKSKKG